MKSKIAKILIAALWLVFIVLIITNTFTLIGIARGFIEKGDSEFVPAVFMIACLIAIVVIAGGIAGGHLLGIRQEIELATEIPKNIKRNIDLGVAVTYLAGGLGTVLWFYKFYASGTTHELTVNYINLIQAPAVLFLGFGLRRMSRVCAALLLCIYGAAMLGASSATEAITPAIQTFFLIRGLIGAIQYHKWSKTMHVVSDK